MEVKTGREVALNNNQKNSLCKKVCKIVETVDSSRKISYICRSNYNTDDESECIFCHIDKNMSTNFYAYCKLYKERLKRFKHTQMAQCCDSCYKELPKDLITEK